MAKEFDLLPLEDSKSRVWSYFGFPAWEGQFLEKSKKMRQHVYCKLCQKPLNYVGNTTNQLVHLKNHHAVEYCEWQAAEKATQGLKATQSQSVLPITHCAYILMKSGPPRSPAGDSSICGST